MRLAVVAALFIVAFFAPTASATDGGPGSFAASGRVPYPGMTPATDARADALQQAALAYWRQEGIGACPAGVETFYADADALGLSGPAWEWDGRAWVRAPGCWALLQRHYVFENLRGWQDRSLRRWHARLECAAWAHEFGHALGLSHDDAPRFSVMRATITRGPQECAHAALGLYPRRAKRVRRNSGACRKRPRPARPRHCRTRPSSDRAGSP